MEADEPEERNRLLREGKGPLKHRNKCLLMAEKYRWDAVEHYEAEPLAENSDDGKKIRKAIKEGRAKKERRKKVTKVRKDTSKPYTNLSKPYFRAIPQANATFWPNNSAQAITYSSENYATAVGNPNTSLETVRPLYLSERDDELSATLYDTYGTSTSRPFIETYNPGVRVQITET